MTDIEKLIKLLEHAESFSLEAYGKSPNLSECSLNIQYLRACILQAIGNAKALRERLANDKTDSEIMQQALDAMMDAMRVSGGISDKMFESVNAISERLAQPEQKPVLQDIEQYRMQMASISTAAIGYWKEGDGIHPDYDTPALRDVAMLYAKYDALYKAQPEQEPVAWLSTDSIGERYLWFSKPLDNDKAQPLYTAPQKREWQGAFFDAVYEAWHSAGMDVLGGDWNTFASTLEAKLKEKNT